MTAQVHEKLTFNGSHMSMCSEPLEQYFETLWCHPRFEMRSTNLWRGYIGTWEIVGIHLYLIELEGMLADGTSVSISTIFPNSKNEILASWFTGQLRIPQGKVLHYVHMGYASRHEQDLIIHIEKGVVTKTIINNNRLTVAIIFKFFWRLLSSVFKNKSGVK